MRVELYDTTLRDGAQRAGLSYSIEDRLRILHRLDAIGVPFIEGGWPGANPRDSEFFALATKERLATSTLTAFGMTRKAGERADRSQVLRDLLDAGTAGTPGDQFVLTFLNTATNLPVGPLGGNLDSGRGNRRPAGDVSIRMGIRK